MQAAQKAGADLEYQVLHEGGLGLPGAIQQSLAALATRHTFNAGGAHAFVRLQVGQIDRGLAAYSILSVSSGPAVKLKLGPVACKP